MQSMKRGGKKERGLVVMSGYKLTAQELKVLDLVAQGQMNKEIEDELGLQKHQVADRIRSLFKKFNVTDRWSLANKAFEAGIIKKPKELIYSESDLEKKIKILEKRKVLFKKEIEVLRLLVKGYNNKRIAETLDKAYYTVSHQVSSINRKLNVNSRLDVTSKIMSKKTI